MKRVQQSILITALFLSSCSIPTTKFSRGAVNVGDAQWRCNAHGAVGYSNYYHGTSMNGTDLYAVLSGVSAGVHFEYGLNNYIDIGAKGWLDLYEADVMIGPTLFIQPIRSRNFNLSIGLESTVGINGNNTAGFNYLFNPKMGISFPYGITALGGWTHREFTSSNTTTIEEPGKPTIEYSDREYGDLTHWSVGAGKSIAFWDSTFYLTPLLIVNWGSDMNSDPFYEIEMGVIFEK